MMKDMTEPDKLQLKHVDYIFYIKPEYDALAAITRGVQVVTQKPGDLSTSLQLPRRRSFISDLLSSDFPSRGNGEHERRAALIRFGPRGQISRRLPVIGHFHSHKVSQRYGSMNTNSAAPGWPRR